MTCLITLGSEFAFSLLLVVVALAAVELVVVEQQ